MKAILQETEFEKHLRRNWRCPLCFGRYLILTRFEDTNTWTAECKSCGAHLRDEYSSRFKAIDAWYDFVDEEEDIKLKNTLTT